MGTVKWCCHLGTVLPQGAVPVAVHHYAESLLSVINKESDDNVWDQVQGRSTELGQGRSTTKAPTDHTYSTCTLSALLRDVTP